MLYVLASPEIILSPKQLCCLVDSRLTITPDTGIRKILMGLCPVYGNEDFWHYRTSVSFMHDTQQKIVSDFWVKSSNEDDNLLKLLQKILNNPPTLFCQFPLDLSSLPEVIAGCQSRIHDIKNVFQLTRCWVYSMIRRKLKITGKF